MFKRLRWLCASGLLVAGVGCQTLGFTSDPSVVVDDPNANEKLQLPPKDGAKACVATAEVLEKSDKIAEATALYERARKLDSSYEYVGRRLAVLYDRQGMFPQADEEYAKAFQASPRDADLCNDYGQSFYLRGNWVKAEEQYRRALDIQPEHKRAWMNLGMALAQQGRNEESYEAFVKVITPAQAHCNLGFVLAAQQKKADAIFEYRQAIRLSPELQIAHAALAKLEGRENNVADDMPATPKRESSPKRDAVRAPKVTTDEAPLMVPETLLKPALVEPIREPERTPEAPMVQPESVLRPDMPAPQREPVRQPRIDDLPPLNLPEPRVPLAPTLEDVPVPPPLPPSKQFKGPTE